jgi:peptidoglycan/LPS O-acetylase OafA/YrhL
MLEKVQHNLGPSKMKKPTSDKPFKREIELDFIRGIAIIMVLDYHSFGLATLSYPFTALGFPLFGWAGVDVFFVLSGFLVGGLLVKEWKLSSRIDSKRFLIRRGFKIWPQYYVFILFNLLAGHRTIRDLAGNLLNIQNYIGGIAHTWSLAVEEHAYLFIVLCLGIAAYRKVRMRSLFLYFAAMIVVVSVLRLILSHQGLSIIFQTHTRIDGILYGVLLAILYHYVPETFHRVQNLVWVWLAVLVGALAFFRFAPTTWWSNSIQYDCANLLGVALLMLLYRHREGGRHWGLYRFVAWIGVYSYGIYLWHVSVVSPSVMIGARLPDWMLPVWSRAAPPILGILVGIVFTKMVEFPALKLRDRLFPRKVDSAVGIPAEVEAKEVSLTSGPAAS